MAGLHSDYVIEQFTLHDSDIKETAELITGGFFLMKQL